MLMIKKTGFFIGLAVLSIIFSCKNSDPGCTFTDLNVTAPANEIATLQNFLNGNGISAVQHPSGFFYSNLNPGSGTKPAVCSTIVVKYAGYLLSNNFKFDENVNGIQFILGKLIVGWQKGLPLIAPGGSITLYIPPSLAYGSSGSGNIPPDAYLKFDLQLLDVR